MFLSNLLCTCPTTETLKIIQNRQPELPQQHIRVACGRRGAGAVQGRWNDQWCRKLRIPAHRDRRPDHWRRRYG